MSLTRSVSLSWLLSYPLNHAQCHRPNSRKRTGKYISFSGWRVMNELYSMLPRLVRQRLTCWSWLCLLCSQDDLKATQEALEGTLLNVLSGSGPYPPPGRPLRNLVARCFVALYSRGNTKSLFETLQALFKTAGEQKIATQDISRV